MKSKNTWSSKTTSEEMVKAYTEKTHTRLEHSDLWLTLKNTLCSIYE